MTNRTRAKAIFTATSEEARLRQLVRMIVDRQRKGLSIDDWAIAEVADLKKRIAEAKTEGGLR